MRAYDALETRHITCMKTDVLTLRIPVELKAELQRVKANLGVPMTVQVQKLIQMDVERRKAEEAR